MTKNVFIIIAVGVALTAFLIAPSISVFAFDMFGVNPDPIGEESGSAGNAANTNNWPSEIQQAIKADQAAAIKSMEESGFQCWDIIRSVNGEVVEIDVDKKWYQRLWDFIVSLIKRLFGVASEKFNFAGTDMIFGPTCSCPPPSFETDPITGEPSKIKITSFFADIQSYRTKVSMQFVWDFLGSGWNCTPGNPEGSNPERQGIPQTAIPESARNLSYPESLIIRNNKGDIVIKGGTFTGSGSVIEAAGTPTKIFEQFNKAKEVGATSLDVSFLDGLIEKVGELIFGKKFEGGREGEVNVEVKGDIPRGAIDKALAFCRSRPQIQECPKHEGWWLDVQVGITDHETGAAAKADEARTGGCPGEYAGETYPIHIKGETIDYQNKKYDIICSATCAHWKCGQEPTEKATCSEGQFSDRNTCIVSCPHGCEAVTKTPGPKCWKCSEPLDISLHVFDYGTNQEYDCRKLGQAQCIMSDRGGDLTFVSKKGLSKEMYPLIAGFRLIESERGPGVYYLGGDELITDINDHYCKDASTDRLRCFKVLFSIKRSERGDGWAGETRVYLKDKNGNTLFEFVSVVMQKNPYR